MYLNMAYSAEPSEPSTYTMYIFSIYKTKKTTGFLSPLQDPQRRFLLDVNGVLTIFPIRTVWDFIVYVSLVYH